MEGIYLQPVLLVTPAAQTVPEVAVASPASHASMMDVSLSLRLPLFPHHLEPSSRRLLLALFQRRPSHFQIALMARLVVITARNAVQQTNTAT